MRVLQVDIGGKRLELHPYISVVAGLDEATRERLLRVLAGVPRGSSAGTRGLVEAHGVLLDLNDQNLALLDLGGEPAASVDPVVRAADVPSASLGPVDRRRVDLVRKRAFAQESLQRAEAVAARADAALVASRDALAALGAEERPREMTLREPRAAVEARRAEREAAERAVAEARRHAEAAIATERAALAAVDEARRKRADPARVQAATEALEQARARRDPFASAALDAARERVSDLESELAAAEAGKAADADAARLAAEVRDARIAELEAHRQELEMSLLSLEIVDPFPVERALAQAESDDTDGLVPSLEAHALADEWVALRERMGPVGSVEGGDARALAAARRRLDEARLAVYEAERAVRVPEVSQADAAAVEAAHEVVLDLQAKSDRRFVTGKARTRLDEARQAEQALLDRLGFVTYADFVMGISIAEADVDRAVALDGARAELAAAEDELTKLERGIDAELEQAELRTELRALRARAVQLLGRDPGDDVEWALRQLRVPADAGTGRFDRLREALTRAGVAVDVSADDVDGGASLLALAHRWVDGQHAIHADRARVERELTAADGQLAALREAAGDHSTVTANAGERRRRIEERLDEALAALEDAQQRVELHAAAEIEIARAKVELEAAMADDDQAAQAIGQLQERAAAATRAASEANVALAAAQAVLDTTSRAASDAVADLAALTAQLDATSELTDRASLEAAVAGAASAADEARAEVAQLRSDVAELDTQIAALPEPSVEAAEIDVDASLEELEWYLLSRLAAQRSVSYAGSLPLVLDNALDGAPGETLDHLLERLERMASAVQVIVLSDEPAVAAWAERAGPDRAAIAPVEALAPA